MNRAEPDDLQAIVDSGVGAVPRSQHPNVDVFFMQKTTGPLPPPAMLREYPPEFQTFILEGARTQGAHRQDMEKRQMSLAENGQAAEIKLLNRDRNHRLLALWMGFAFLAAPPAIAAWAMLKGHETIAVAALVASAGISLPRLIRALKRVKAASEAER